MEHDDVVELLGAYAIDAVEADEAEAVARHIETCPRCAQEVDEHRETASALAFAGETAPDGLWDRIQERLEEAPPDLDLAPIVPFRRRPLERQPGGAGRRSVGLRAAALAAATAAAVVIAVLGVQVSDLRTRVANLTPNRVPGVERPVTVAMRSPDGTEVVPALLTADGTGYVGPGRLPDLPAGQTYQLWVIVGGRRISVGVLGNHLGLSTFKASGTVEMLAITAEDAPGATTSTRAPVVIGTVPRRA